MMNEHQKIAQFIFAHFQNALVPAKDGHNAAVAIQWLGEVVNGALIVSKDTECQHDDSEDST